MYLIRKLLADSGYDSSEIKQLLRDIGIKPVIASNGRGHYKSATPKDKDYSKRWAIERNNSLMKEYYNLNDVKVKGIKAVLIHCLLCYNSMLVASIGKYLLGYKKYRSVC